MSPRPDPDDRELAALAAAAAALSSLPDPSARRRVLSYMLSRYLPDPDGGLGPGLRMPEAPASGEERELPGIARLSPAGELSLTVRDLRARSALEAAARLALVAIYAHERLAGRPLSSRRDLTPLLKAWRLYDGNTRTRLARERGIVRRGDDLTLDDEGRRRAERLVEELRAPERGQVPERRRAARWGPPDPSPAAPPAEPPPAAAGPERALRPHDDFENWDNFAHRCAVGMHAVDRQGIVLWANETELAYLGYRPEEFIGRPIEAFHLDQDVIHDILRRLIEGETVNARPVRMRAKDGSPRYVLLTSNVYRRKGGEFGHTRCFSVGIAEATWKALKAQWEKQWAA